MKKVRLATVWLDGCAGCHMSILDMDETILQIAKRVELVYGPLVDAQEFPKAVDVTVVEGAVSSQDDLEKVHTLRKRSKLVVSLGPPTVSPRSSARPSLSTKSSKSTFTSPAARRPPPPSSSSSAS